MAIDNIKPAYFLGQPNLTNPKVLGSKVAEIIDELNSPTGTGVTPSSGTFTVTGDLSVTDDVSITDDLAVGDALGVTGTTSLAGLLLLTGTPQTLTGAGAVNLTTKVTLLVTTGANALTLAAGTDGQIKIIKHKTDGGDGTLTVTGASGFTTITFSAVGQTATLLYKDSSWNVISTFGAVVA